jgi:hypothetical protein
VNRGETFRALAALSYLLISSPLLISCGTPPSTGAPVSLEKARTPGELAALLDSLGSRTDAEACVGRARICARLRHLEGKEAVILRTRGDAADVDVLSQAAPDDLKAESAGRLARHFLERAAEPPQENSPFQGAPGTLLRRFVLLSVASTFAEYAPQILHAEILDGVGAVADEMAAIDKMRPELQKDLRNRAKAAALQAAILRAAEDRGEVPLEARKFAEVDLSRHLDEATRSADRATSEKAARGDVGRIQELYLAALTHYVVARECMISPTPAQEHTLSGMEIVVRGLCELLRAEP